MMIGFAFLVIALLGLMAFVRLAPSDPAVWNVAPPPVGAATSGQVAALTGAASLLLGPDAGDPTDVLTKLDAVAVATPRTTRLAGSVADGRITWITRSALWGFPDYTTAQLTDGGVAVYARLRFGREDMGVNAARLTDWAAQLSR